ncbi:MAG: hypothetical protein ACLGHQ_04270 [Acidimicrobiia bacterium]
MSEPMVDPGAVLFTGDVAGTHECPVCDRVVVDVYRPGRGRVYCTNACRQRAYRWRRARGVRLFVERDGPAERLTNDRHHAVRDPRDPVAGIRDRRGREVAVCGAYARPVRSQRVTHDRFVPEHPWSCRSCIASISPGPPGTGIPEIVRRYAGGPGWPSLPWSLQRDDGTRSSNR